MRRPILLLTASTFLLAAPAADAATVSSYVRYGEGDTPGVIVPARIVAGPGAVVGGQQNGTGSSASFHAALDGGEAEYLDLGAGGGRALLPGVYDGAGTGLGPNLTVVGYCTQEDGRFEILDYAAGPDRKVTRAWVLFEERCYKREVHYGEIRINMPVADAPAYTVPGIVRWGAGDPGRPRYDVPVSVYATEATQVVGATISGPDASSFEVTANACGSLAAGQRCSVFTRYKADGPGARTAKLTITFAGGATQVVPLQGFTYGGRSQLALVPEPGEPLTDGAGRTFTAAADGLSAHEQSNGGFTFAVDGADDAWWYIDIAPPEGGTLAPGRYTGATGGGAPSPKLRISGDGTSCGGSGRGEFTITALTRAFGGRLRSVGATFESRCSAGGPALRGTLEWRAGDDGTSAPWMGSAPYTPTPPGGGGAGAGGTAPPAASAPAAPGTARTLAAGAIDCRALPLRRRATAGADRLLGTRGRDRLLGGLGGDCLSGAAGNDLLRGGGGDDRLTGGAGRDDLRGEAGDDTLSGGAGADALHGGAGGDALSGGSGADTLRGGAGNDRLSGGPGRDLLDCGSGRDIAVAGKGDRVRGCERVER